MGNKHSSFDLTKDKESASKATATQTVMVASVAPQQAANRGMLKAKSYDWKDSNLALFGSDVEKKVKKEAAETEPAWKGAGKKVGIQIWRIVKFKVTHWPKEDYGKFYDGDSYIILSTYTEGNSMNLLYDVHFWIGKHSSQDEYGTAAYKTVELDTLLGDLPVQHREVQGHESDLFRSYFETIELLSGGADTGFRHVEPTKYLPRLLHFHGDKHGVKVKEIPKCKDLLDKNDVYILDLGKTLIQWNGSGANKDERFKASNYLNKLRDERSGTKQIVDDGQDDYTFLSHLKDEMEEDDDYNAADDTKELYRLSNATGKMIFTKEKTGSVTKGDFDSSDVFIYDTKQKLYVWIGLKTTQEEKKNAMTYAHNYLMKTDHPLISVSCFSESKPTKDFNLAIAA